MTDSKLLTGIIGIILRIVRNKSLVYVTEMCEYEVRLFISNLARVIQAVNLYQLSHDIPCIASGRSLRSLLMPSPNKRLI